jgi:hypothetical protein
LRNVSTQASRAEQNGISKRSQETLDRIAREAPELLAGYQVEYVLNLIFYCIAIAVPAVAGHGEIGNGRSRDYENENVISTQQGNSSTYRIGKLKRDHPDVFQALGDAWSSGKRRGQRESVYRWQCNKGYIGSNSNSVRIRAWCI